MEETITKEQNQNRDFKGVWIPKEIWLDERLSATDKALLIEIDSLDNGEEHCYAGNTYLANFLQVSKKTISRSIAKLCEYGYINFVGLTEGRKRTLSSNIHSGTEHGSMDKVSRELRQNVQAAKTKCLDNNIYNNINNNSVVVEKIKQSIFTYFPYSLAKESSIDEGEYKGLINLFIRFIYENNRFSNEEINKIVNLEEAKISELFMIFVDLDIEKTTAIGRNSKYEYIKNPEGFMISEIKKTIKKEDK